MVDIDYINIFDILQQSAYCESRSTYILHVYQVVKLSTTKRLYKYINIYDIL